MDGFARQQDGNGKWVVTGKGTMVRQSAEISELPAATSQFYEKTLKHEQTHKDQYEKKNAQGQFLYYNVDIFYDRIKNFMANSENELCNMVIGAYNQYAGEMETAIGTDEARELEAYHSEYDVEPKGVRERSDTWIKARY